MEPYKDNTFIARWQDRTLDADAYVYFSTNIEGKIRLQKNLERNL